MPIVTMASPITTSHVYLIPEAGSLNNLSRRRERKKKIIVIKVLQLILICICMLLFSLSNKSMTNMMIDIYVCYIFGICLIYPIFVLTGTVNKVSKSLIIFNFSGGLLLLAAGLILIYSCITIFELIEGATNMGINTYTASTYSLNLKLLSGVIALINGVLYFADCVLLIMYYCSNMAI